MDFDFFISNIPLLKSKPLPGITAHQPLAPEDRPFYSDDEIKQFQPKKAAVLALIYPDKNNQACIILTKRARYNGAHSQEISFPGGKHNSDDAHMKATSLRETFEETNIKQEQIQTIRQLSNIYIPPSNFEVSAFIGYTMNIDEINPNYEVSEIIKIKIEDLLNDSFIQKDTINQQQSVPCFVFKGHVIWGATAMILNEIKALLKSL